MVRTLALALPAGGTILDVGNGLATQDPLIAEAIRPGCSCTRSACCGGAGIIDYLLLRGCSAR